MQLISQGAEAKIFKTGDSILKDRIKKNYRITEIDERLRKSRTRREAKILETLLKLKFPAPKLIKTFENVLEIEYIPGPKIRDILEKSDYSKFSREIGKKLSILHNNKIVHGDLTTSNMILNKEIYFIDFGLSFFSDKLEDKAVDLHLLRQALESKHHKIWKKCLDVCLSSYKKYAKDSAEILKRLEIVELRGRNKNK